MKIFKRIILGLSITLLGFNTSALAEEQTTIQSTSVIESSVQEVTNLTNVDKPTTEETDVVKISAIQYGVLTPPELMLSKLREVEESNDLTSSDDERRIPALEKEYGITIDESMHWSVKYPNYTPMATLKELGYYHINANRQNLILYAIQKNDWQPYRAYEAKQTPLYFEIVDGKFEYSKIYWGKMIESTVSSYRSNMNVLMQGRQLSNYAEPQTVATLTESFNKEMKNYVANFNAAKGYVPYVVGLNSTEEYVQYWGADVPEKDFVNSKYNHPDVMAKGKFKAE